MYVNLVLMVVWLAVGVALLLWQWVNPQNPYANFWGSGLSVGWVAILLAVYNLVRWCADRAYRARQEAAREAQYPRQRDEHAPRPPQKPDPNFNFSDRPPKPEDETREGA